jgi:hypothetical protein
MVDNLIKQGRAKPGHYLYSNKKLKYDKASNNRSFETAITRVLVSGTSNRYDQ